MQTTELQPLATAKRTTIVDILRGWAILGVVMGNYGDYAGMGKPVKIHPDIVSQVLSGINQFVFAAKSWTLLSVLFGYGFAVVMNNVAAKGKNPLAFFGRRMFWLFVIAFVNSAFWWGDILKDYAALGLVLLVFYKSSAKTTFRLACVLLGLLPLISALVSHFLPFEYDKVASSLYPIYYSHNWFTMWYMNLKGTYILEVLSPGYAITVHVMMLACMLLGFSAQRIDFFNRLPEFKKQLKLMFWISLSGVAVFTPLLIFAFNSSLIKYFNPRYWLVFSTMLFIATSICRLYLNNKLQNFFPDCRPWAK